jgi:uncharacterized protein YndB with AHSA1/START domain
MTYDLRIERHLDAPPDLVFDTIVDPAAQTDLFSGVVEGWGLRSFEIDLRVGGTWAFEFGPLDGVGEPDTITNVFTEIDRPRVLAYDVTMYVSEWGRSVSYAERITFEGSDAGTLLVVEERGFETAEVRDSFLSGTPSWVDAVERVVMDRARTGSTRP